MNAKEEASYAELVGSLYLLLAQCLSRPTSELAEKLLDKRLQTAFEEAFADSKSQQCESALMKLADISGKHNNAEDLRLFLELDYNRLFVGPEKLLAPPYESVYLSSRTLSNSGINEKMTIDSIYASEIKREYAEVGFVPAAEFNDFADHIALEIEFMGHLYGLIAKELANNNRQLDGDSLLTRINSTRENFARNHLSKWLPTLYERVSKNSSTDFYTAIVGLAKTMAELENESVRS